uniref:Uncharacterized protein n=1 Tax=Arion vulgaris TaxID=1028688 RepID=A0A0B7A6F6_9EUPU
MSLPHVPPGGVGVGNQFQERQKVLEKVNEQKKRLQYGHHGSSSSTSSAITVTAIQSSSTPSVPAVSFRHLHCY